ncbi:MAG: diguanylate cyclase [Phormidesmis sp.]
MVANGWHWLQQQPRLLRAGLLLIIYLVLGLSLEGVADYYRASLQTQPWDPASGLHIVLLLGFGLRYTPAIFLIPFLEDAIWPVAQPEYVFEALSAVHLCVGYGAACAFLLHKVEIDPRLQTLRDSVWFTLVLSIASLLISGFSVSTHFLAIPISPSEWFQRWMQEWAGELTGIMVSAPPILIWMRSLPWTNKHLTLRSRPPDLSWGAWNHRENLEWAAVMAVTVLFTWLAYDGIKSKSIDYSYFTFLPLIWTATRYGLPRTTVTILIINIAAVLFVGRGGSGETNILAVQFGLMTVSLVGILLGAYVTDRQLEMGRREALEERLRFDATHDHLTGLYNRTLLNDRLAQVIHTAQKDENYLFALLFLDLDGFKDVNDSYGHLIGDRLLVMVAERIKACVPDESISSRFGGDEFVILFSRIVSHHEAEHYAQQLCEALSHAYSIDSYQLSITVSIGIALGSQQESSAVNLLRNADIALYEAKDRGRSQFVVFSHQMYEALVRRTQTKSDLRRAIRDLEDE